MLVSFKVHQPSKEVNPDIDVNGVPELYIVSIELEPVASKGEVNIQTRYPNHPLFKYVKDSQYTEYAKTLLTERKDTLLPPYAHQALICANAKDKNVAEKFLNEVAQLINNIDIKSVEIWGPVPGVIEKKSNYYYFNLYLQSADRSELRRLIQTFYQHVEKIKVISSVRWYVDIDPIE